MNIFIYEFVNILLAKTGDSGYESKNIKSVPPDSKLALLNPNNQPPG